jgi:hypothetical protein
MRWRATSVCGSRWRWLVACVAMVALAAPAASVVAVSTKAADHPLLLFDSEQTGYFFFWDPEIWSVAGESSEPGIDWIRFADGEIVVDYSALVAPGLSVTSCLQRELDQLASNPSIVAVEALTAEGGAPELHQIGPPQTHGQATEVVVTVAEGERNAKYAVELTCSEIASGRSLLVTSAVVPGRIFNERGWMSLLGPAVATFDHFAAEEANGRSIAIPGQHGDVAGTLTRVTACSSTTVFVLARGEGQQDFVIDPASFAAVDLDGTSKSISLAWSVPERAADAPVTVHPGELALFQILVDSPAFELSYRSPAGQVVDIGQFIAGCGGGGGGAPVLIDVE